MLFYLFVPVSGLNESAVATDEQLAWTREVGDGHVVVFSERVQQRTHGLLHERQSLALRAAAPVEKNNYMYMQCQLVSRIFIMEIAA